MFLLPVIATILLFIISYSKEHSLYKGISFTWLLYTMVSWLSIEVLGWFYLWNSVTVSLVWLFVIVVCIYIIYKRNLGNVIWRNILSFRDSRAIRFAKEHRFIVGSAIIFACMVFVIALMKSPNNVDSMIYHLPRIMHWIQEQSARPYAAGTDLQIRYPALSEYLIAQIAVLGAHDRLYNIYQTMAYFLSGVMIYGIGRRMRVSSKMAYLSVWFYWTIPMAMLQAFTTQTDNIACLFLLIYIYYLLDFIEAEHLPGGWRGGCASVRLAASVMFGYLCKPTICFAMVVFFFWMCIVRIIKRDPVVMLLKYIGVGTATALILYAPTLMKSYDIYVVQQRDSGMKEEDNMPVLGGEKDARRANTGVYIAKAANTLAPDSFNVTKALKNPVNLVMICIQNVGRNSFSAYFPQWNNLWLELVNKLGNKLNYDTQKFKVQEGTQFWVCDTASAPALMLISLFIGVCFVTGVSRLDKQKKIFVICAVLSFFIQCALMGYTSFRTRYLVGAMALLAISAGIVLDGMEVKESSKQNIGIWMLSFCMLGAVNSYYFEAYWTLDSFRGESTHKYFLNNYWPEESNQEVIDVINANNYVDVGVYGGYTYEYILWKKISGLQRLENVNLQNEYHVYEDMTYHPECILWEIGSDEEPESELECHGIKYVLTWSTSGYGQTFSLYQPEDVEKSIY